MHSSSMQNRAFAWRCYSYPHCWCQMQAAYAPLYKADARAEARTIESPFSQTLTSNSQENKSQPAAEKPVSMCKSMSLKVCSSSTSTNLSALSNLVSRAPGAVQLF